MTALHWFMLLGIGAAVYLLASAWWHHRWLQRLDQYEPELWLDIPREHLVWAPPDVLAEDQEQGM